MTRHTKRDVAPAVRHASAIASQQSKTAVGGLAPVRYTTLPATSGRVTKKSTLLRPAARAAAKVAPVVAPHDDLERQLAEAEARIVALEARLNTVTDRVAWIADRLHALLSDQD
jgi:hypothetical protein